MLFRSGELTAYGAAWKRGEAWSLPPSPIPIGYLTRAAYLWRNGEAYKYLGEPDVELPLAWVLDPSPAGSARPRSDAPDEGGARAVTLLDAPRSLAALTDAAVAEMPLTFVLGRSVAVQIAVRPPSGTSVYALEEKLPEGWTANDVSDDGFFDSATRKVKWGPFFDAASRVLKYAALPSQGAGPSAWFEGVVSVDGSDSTVAGQRQAVAVPPGSGLGVALVTRADGSRALEISLDAPIGGEVRIDTSEDLRDWRPHSTVINEFGRVVIDDPGLLALPNLFLRVRPVADALGGE